jgi:hypothetical protein
MVTVLEVSASVPWPTTRSLNVSWLGGEPAPALMTGCAVRVVALATAGATTADPAGWVVVVVEELGLLEHALSVRAARTGARRRVRRMRARQ